MPKKKNQHFVPRFYLQRFSRNGDQRSVSLFQAKRGLFVKYASISDQASRNYYYGEDGKVEDELGNLEGVWAENLRSIDQNDVPATPSDRFNLLLDFICFTDFRNPIRADQIEALSDVHGESTRKLYEVMEEENIQESEKFLKTAKERLKENKVVESLRNAKRSVEVVSDLKLKLLINKTTKPFLTSDYPIVHYNQFFEARSQRHIPFGIGNSGVQIFMPLDSKLGAVLYDNERYYVGQDKLDFVLITKEKDVDQLNILQYQSCLNSVYGDETFTKDYAEFLQKRSSRHQKSHAITYKIVQDSPTSNNVFTRPFNIKCKLELSFLSLKLSASKARLNPNSIYLRPGIEELRRQMDMQDRVANVRFRKFLRDHVPLMASRDSD